LLRVTHASAGDRFDIARAKLIAARRAQAELDALLGTGLLSRSEHAERRATFQRTVIESEAALRTPEGDEAEDEVIDGALLAAQKAALGDAARRGLVAAETADREIGELDRKLLHLASAHGSHEDAKEST
jgi:CPA1 family monovalent cation:H+ antiporter